MAQEQTESSLCREKNIKYDADLWRCRSKKFRSSIFTKLSAKGNEDEGGRDEKGTNKKVTNSLKQMITNREGTETPTDGGVVYTTTTERCAASSSGFSLGALTDLLGRLPTWQYCAPLNCLSKLGGNLSSASVIFLFSSTIKL